MTEPKHNEREAMEYRRLTEGETILATDEIYNDGSHQWQPVKHSVGQPAPDPKYTSHRQFRRRIGRDEQFAIEADRRRIVAGIEAELLLDGTPDFGDAMWNSALAKAVEIVRGEI